MANIAGTRTNIADFSPFDGFAVVWPLANGDIGVQAINGPTYNSMAGSSDRSVQVSGTFGAGGTLIIEGSNDGTHWSTMDDPQGNALSMTTAGIKQILEISHYIRPRVTAGDGTTALNVVMFFHSSLRP